MLFAGHRSRLTCQQHNQGSSQPASRQPCTFTFVLACLQVPTCLLRRSQTLVGNSDMGGASYLLATCRCTKQPEGAVCYFNTPITGYSTLCNKSCYFKAFNLEMINLCLETFCLMLKVVQPAMHASCNRARCCMHSHVFNISSDQQPASLSLAGFRPTKPTLKAACKCNFLQAILHSPSFNSCRVGL